MCAPGLSPRTSHTFLSPSVQSLRMPCRGLFRSWVGPRQQDQSTAAAGPDAALLPVRTGVIVGGGGPWPILATHIVLSGCPNRR